MIPYYSMDSSYTVAEYHSVYTHCRPVLRCYHTGTITTVKPEQFNHSFIESGLNGIGCSKSFATNSINEIFEY